MIGARREDIDGLDYWTAGRGSKLDGRQQLLHLLPIYDEYLVAYRDRVAVPHRPVTASSKGIAVTFQHSIVIDGQVAGTWRITRTTRGVTIDALPFRRLSAVEGRALAAAAERYEAVMQVPVKLSVSSRPVL
jgi:hypothetical protein